MRKRLMFAAALAVALAASYAASLRATPQSGFTSQTIATARFGPIDVRNKSIPADTWMQQLKTRGLTDVYVQQNTWVPGGTSGWHTHPGGSLIIVTSGAVTAYEGDDPACTPHVYTAGMGFVDAGGDHVHLIRNEGTINATSVTVQFLQATLARRIDVPDPGNCVF
jgi:hypothetical protein